MDQTQPVQGMGQRRFGRVNWLGLWTMIAREVQRFLAVWTQTVLAPVITAILFMAIFALAFGERIDPAALAGLGLILVGVAAARSGADSVAEARRRTLPGERVQAAA